MSARYGSIDGRLHIKLHTDERKQVRSVRSFLTITHPSTNRKSHVRYGGRCSKTSLVHYGVPQGSVLFIMYTADLIALIQQHGLQPHMFADDTQIVGSCCPTPVDTTTLRHRIEICVADIANWMSSKQLQQNTSKSEVLWCSTSGRRHLIPSDHLIVGSDVSCPSSLLEISDYILIRRCH